MDAPTRHLDYATSIPRKSINWKLHLTIIASLGLLPYIALTILAPDTSFNISICTKCGMHERIDQRYFPLTPVPFHQSRMLSPTPLSAVLQKHQLRFGHTHQFIYAFGSSRTFGARACGSGPGKNIDPIYTAAFIDALATWSDRTTTEKWLSIVLDPNRRWSHDRDLVQVQPFSSQVEFQTWWRRRNGGQPPLPQPVQ